MTEAVVDHRLELSPPLAPRGVRRRILGLEHWPQTVRGATEHGGRSLRRVSAQRIFADEHKFRSSCGLSRDPPRQHLRCRWSPCKHDGVRLEGRRQASVPEDRVTNRHHEGVVDAGPRTWVSQDGPPESTSSREEQLRRTGTSSSDDDPTASRQRHGADRGARDGHRRVPGPAAGAARRHR